MGFDEAVSLVWCRVISAVRMALSGAAIIIALMPFAAQAQQYQPVEHSTFIQFIHLKALVYYRPDEGKPIGAEFFFPDDAAAGGTGTIYIDLSRSTEALGQVQPGEGGGTCFTYETEGTSCFVLLANEAGQLALCDIRDQSRCLIARVASQEDFASINSPLYGQWLDRQTAQAAPPAPPEAPAPATAPTQPPPTTRFDHVDDWLGAIDEDGWEVTDAKRNHFLANYWSSDQSCGTTYKFSEQAATLYHDGVALVLAPHRYQLTSGAASLSAYLTYDNPVTIAAARDEILSRASTSKGEHIVSQIMEVSEIKRDSAIIDITTTFSSDYVSTRFSKTARLRVGRCVDNQVASVFIGVSEDAEVIAPFLCAPSDPVNGQISNEQANQVSEFLLVCMEIAAPHYQNPGQYCLNKYREEFPVALFSPIQCTAQPYIISSEKVEIGISNLGQENEFYNSIQFYRNGNSGFFGCRFAKCFP